MEKKIEKGGKGIVKFVVPCQPQGHIPQIRISPQWKKDYCFSGNVWPLLSVAAVMEMDQSQMLQRVPRALVASKMHIANHLV